MNEEKNKKIEVLKKQFWEKIDAIPEPNNKGKLVLDDGYSEANDIYKWYKSERLKIDEEYA